LERLNRDDIEHYLQMLGQELAAQQRTGAIFLVGGAVMILTIGNRNSTRDIDASFVSETPAIRAAVEQIAQREGLPSDWLNDAAKGFLYTSPPVSLWKHYPGLDIYLPGLDYILAMKIVAGRLRDLNDARALIQHLKLNAPQEVLDILKRYVPAQYLTVRVQYIVEDLFA
jgi:hypothetical protein